MAGYDQFGNYRREPWEDLPEPEERREYDAEECEVEIDVDQVIIVDETGFEYEDEDYTTWAGNPETQNDRWSPGIWDAYIEGESIDLIDPYDVVEKLDYFLDDEIPDVPGKYRLRCTLRLNFTVMGIEYRDIDEYDRETYTDNVEVEYNKEKSGIEDLSIEAI